MPNGYRSDICSQRSFQFMAFYIVCSARRGTADSHYQRILYEYDICICIIVQHSSS